MIDPKTFFSSPGYLEKFDRVYEQVDILEPHLIGPEPPRARDPYNQEIEESREMNEMVLDGDLTIFTGCQCDACVKARTDDEQPRYGKFAAYADLISSKDAPPNEDEFFFLCSYKVVAFVLRVGKWSMYCSLSLLLLTLS